MKPELSNTKQVVHLVGMMKIKLPEIILFGLSADMLHKGHVEWITTLKNKFPNHTIIIMPCSSNPLGKKDENGNIIYPSNGFLRWQMLYEYFQKHDKNIIVSQYEIAINIPSKTYTTIQYLQHTSVADIKNQRGYVLPTKYSNELINNISIAIGTDIITEFDKWYEWEKILKIAKIIVMNRANFGQIDVRKLKNHKLKSSIIKGLKQGSIIEICGPQINISSRQLKKMLQEKVKDEFLLEYIPIDILNYIKKHQSEFSNAYYQNQKARETYDLAMQAYKEALQKFDLNRKTNFSAFITDFAKITNIDKYYSEGYKLINGRLDVDLAKVDNIKLNGHIKNWMLTNHCEWYETKKPSGKIIPPHPFNANFKLLGKYGPNLAIDLILFIKDKNKLKLLTITRNDDKKCLAIPGGFYQGDIFTTAINELLEECFSNKLFSLDSRSSKIINKIYKNKHDLLYAKITNISLEIFKNEKLQIKIKKISDVNSPFAIINAVMAIIDETYKNRAHHQQLMSKLKCELYKHLMPENYKKLNDFIINKGILSPEELSLTDPRNTNLAWIVIKNIRFIISIKEWHTLLRECALDLSGGDDAALASIVDLKKFCNSSSNNFALHKYLVLRNLAKFYESYCNTTMF